SAGREDVVDDQDALARIQAEAAPELAALAVRRALGIDRARAELAGDLVRDDDAAGRGPRDRLHTETARGFRDRRAQPLGLLRPLQHLELLEVEGRVLAGAEEEVALEVGPGPGEDVLDDGRSDAHPLKSMLPS